MNKDLKKAIKKISNEDIIEIPEILPSFAPANKQDYVNKMAEKVLTGELTYYDVGRELQLTNNQIEYCKYFAVGETMGNGTQSAMRAYDYDPADKAGLKVCANHAYQYNKPTHPCSTLVQILIHGEGLNDNNLDLHLKFVCEQNFDMKAKVLAIREANTLKGRNNKKVIEVNVSHKLDYSTLPKKELQKLVEIARKAKIKEDESD